MENINKEIENIVDTNMETKQTVDSTEETLKNLQATTTSFEKRTEKIIALINGTISLYTTNNSVKPKFKNDMDKAQYNLEEARKKMLKYYNIYNKLIEVYLTDEN